VARVCTEYQLSEDVLASPNRARRHAEARACIAWHATNSGAATLAEVARRFNRTESVLCRAVSRYRRRQ
jgi:chromosomal replication initiation ATPase DnaA